MSWNNPFWLSATFKTCETIVADNLPSSLLHWRAFGGNGNSPHLQDFQQSPFGLKTPHIGDYHITIRFTTKLYKNYEKQKSANVSLVAIYETVPLRMDAHKKFNCSKLKYN